MNEISARGGNYRFFDVDVLLSITSHHIFAMPFSRIHLALEELAGCPLMIYDLVHIVPRIIKQLIRILPMLDVDASDVTTENWQEWLADWKRKNYVADDAIFPIIVPLVN